MSHSLFIVEGVHDVEVVARLLDRRGFRRLVHHAELPEFWERLVPNKFPHEGDLLRRVPVPLFLQSESNSVAIHSAIGLERIARTLGSSLLGLPDLPGGIGILLDADCSELPEARWQQLTGDLKGEEGVPPLDWGEGPGRIGKGIPRSGVFVLPDNRGSGTLETVLLECAEKVYPKLFDLATSYVGSISPSDADILPSSKDRQDYKKPAGRQKATAGAISSILRPGKAIQVSIQDNSWLSHDKAFQLSSVQELQRFVDSIAGLDNQQADASGATRGAA